ncbi:hypothetical protein U3516DRAFT_769768 [Neocallimastix sp. 'constans']
MVNSPEFDSTLPPKNNSFNSLNLNRTSHRLHYDRASQFGVIPVYCKSKLVNYRFPNLEKGYVCMWLWLAVSNIVTESVDAKMV